MADGDERSPRGGCAKRLLAGSRDFAVQSESGTVPLVVDDLDLAPVHVVGADEGRGAKEGTRPGLDEGFLRGPQAARVTCNGLVVADGTGLRTRC